MSEKILVPALGESVTEATVSKWLKNEGDQVSSDEPIVELETDKVNIEVPAPSNGTLQAISAKEGDTVNVGALLGSISDSATGSTNQLNKEQKYSPPPKQQIQKQKVAQSSEKKIEKKERIIEVSLFLMLRKNIKNLKKNNH